MDNLNRSLRMTLWLLQSFIKRYRVHIIMAFTIGTIAMIAVWRFIPLVQAQIFPERTVVGVVGNYRVNELPVTTLNYISAGFTEITENGETEPLAVTKWETSKEGTLYFFHLNQDLRWHDGQEFTAHDVNYSFRDVSINAADRYTLKMELSQPFTPLPTLLSRPLFKEGLVGIGPYEIVQLKLKTDFVDQLILKKSDEPVIEKELPYDTDLIEFRFYPSLEAAILAFKLGEIDHIDDIAIPTELADEHNVTITETVDTSKVLALFYNTTNDMFGAKEIRQALSYATPALDGVSVPSAIPTSSWAYNENARSYAPDIDRAKEMIETAGIEGADITLSVFPEYYIQADRIAAAWRDLGLNAHVQVVRTLPPDYQVLLGVQELPSDPDQYQLWHSTQNVTNITHYNNPKIDKLLEEGRTLQIKEERLEVYKEFQRYIMEDVPAHFLIHPTTYRISRT